MTEPETKLAVLYRMVLPDHVCPYGAASLDLLKQQGFEVDDRHLTTRQEVDAFMEENGVETTPLTFIEDEPVGGYDDLCERFGVSGKMPY